VTATSLRLEPTMRSTNFANWIIYRLTDVMLMQAEALIEKGELDKAFAIINTVNMRANCISLESSSLLKQSNYPAQSDMRDLLMEERQRELLFEGKRWYDLVRMARREGNTRSLANTVVKKQKVNKDAIKIKLADANALYFPYSRDELKVNPNLHQNPAYTTGDDADLEKN
jgi:hypothetical protein